MTRFGKILVLINLFLAMTFAVVAFAIKTQGVDWTAARVVSKDATVRVPNPSGKQVSNSESKDTGVATVQKDADPTVVQIKGLQEGTTRVVLTDPQGQKQGFDVHVDRGFPGKLSERIDELRELREVRGKAEEDVEAAYSELVALEKERPVAQKWYAEQLDKLEHGQEPVQQITYAGGKVQIGTGERPVLEKATSKNFSAIYPREYYTRQLDQIAKEIGETRRDIQKRLGDQERLADELKDLRAKLAREEEGLRKIAEEREYLQPVLYNAESDAQRLRDRQKQLEMRLKELERAGGSGK